MQCARKWETEVKPNVVKLLESFFTISEIKKALTTKGIPKAEKKR